MVKKRLIMRPRLAWIALTTGLAVACQSAPAPVTADAPVPPSAPVSVEPTPAPEVVLLSTPDLPDSVVIQFFHRGSGYTQRITRDGRYLVTLPGGAETARRPAGADGWEGLPGAEDELARLLLKKIDEIDFFALPPDLGSIGPTADGVLHPVAVSVRRESGVHTVALRSAGPLARSAGPLTPLYVELDRLAIGSGEGE
jgi:hypothetical protein